MELDGKQSLMRFGCCGSVHEVKQKHQATWEPGVEKTINPGSEGLSSTSAGFHLKGNLRSPS